MQEERFYQRDLTYSLWHRRRSVSRYVGSESAQLLSMCDVDCVLWLEYDYQDKRPLALIETAMDVGQSHKPATAIRNLAVRAKVPAYLCLYSKANYANPSETRCNDISGFRVKRLWPDPEHEWRSLSPQEWASALLRIRSWQARKLDQEAAEERKLIPPLQLPRQAAARWKQRRG
jgi:hypothetical protein